jgi:NADPH2 dehydrogenase
VTDAVHANGSYIFLQLWALGRVADPTVLENEGPYQVVGASPIPLKGQNMPRELSNQELKEYLSAYATAASNAVHKAGFDGVEIHVSSMLASFMVLSHQHHTLGSKWLPS